MSTPVWLTVIAYALHHGPDMLNLWMKRIADAAENYARMREALRKKP